MSKSVELDTPFRKGEVVLTTRTLEDVPDGTRGKIQLRNGLTQWTRYWVMFEGGRQMGQVDHQDLVRPHMLDKWKQREEDRALAAEQSAARAEAATEASAAGDAGGGGGIASQIPAHLLERSKAAKARLLGG